MKYLFIDTNIYIQCCLLELEGDDLNTLKDLHKLLDKEKIKLLFPEVVKLELAKVLDEKLKLLKKEIGSIKEFINESTDLDKRIKKDLINKLDKCLEEREKNTGGVKKEINKIFSSPNVIKKGLEIKSDNLISAYKDFLKGRKPYNRNEKTAIQPDCVIISMLKEYFKDKRNYVLFFCSRNKNDFAQEGEVEDTLVLHEDISERFKNAKYYRNLFELLNKEFSAKYPKKSIEKLEEKETKPLFDRLSKIVSTGAQDGRFQKFLTNYETASFSNSPATLSGSTLSEYDKLATYDNSPKSEIGCLYCSSNSLADGETCPYCKRLKIG